MDARRRRRLAYRSGLSSQAKGFQLWIALPEELENAPSQSHYLSESQVPAEEPARVILGSYGRAKSAIARSCSASTTWTFNSRPVNGGPISHRLDHEVAWLAVSDGTIRTPEPVSAGEFVAFEESNERPCRFEAETASRFVLGSAAKHPHDLVLGHYSVHTSRAALAAGESEIQRIGNQLQAAGLLR